MWLSALVYIALEGFFIGLGVFVALTLHNKVLMVREKNGGRAPLRDIVAPVANLLADTTPQMLDDMTEEEYEELRQGGNGKLSLIRAIESKLPWNQKDKTSQSSDT